MFWIKSAKEKDCTFERTLVYCKKHLDNLSGNLEEQSRVSSAAFLGYFTQVWR